MKPKSNPRFYRGLFATICASAPLSASAAPLYQWKFDGAVGTPFLTAGGGNLTPLGTANFAGTGVSGLPGDNAFSVSGATNGNSAFAGGTDVLTGVGTLSNFTVTMWVRSEPGSTTAFPRLLQLGATATPDSNSNPGINLLINTGNLEIGVNGGVNSLNTGASFANGVWRFVAFSYDGTATNPYFSPANQALYTFNGNPVANNSVVLTGTTSTPVAVSGTVGLNTGALPGGTFNTSPGPAAIGASGTLYLGNRANGQRGLTGFLDDVRIYNTQLTRDEIEAIRLESAPPPPPGGTATYWKGGTSGAWNAANWTSDLAGASPTALAVDGSAAATFAASSPANLAATVLGADQNVKSLKFNTQATGVGIGGVHNLTVGDAGMTLDADAGVVEINTTGNVILGAAQTWTNLSPSLVTVTSPVTGAFPLTTAGPGTTLLGGANSHGATIIESGTLRLGNTLALGPVTNSLTINGGTLDLNNINPEIARLTGGSSGFITNSVDGLATLTVNSPALATDLFTGHINDGAAGQAVALTKTGPGTLTLGGSGNFTGNVHVKEGVLAAALFSNGPAVTSALGNAQFAGRTITIDGGATLSFTFNNTFGNQNSVGSLLPEITISSTEFLPGTVSAIRFNVLGKVTMDGGILTQTATSSNDVLFQGYQFRSDIVATGTRPSLISSATGRANHLSAETYFDVADVTGSEDVDLTVSNPLWNQSGDLASAPGSLVKIGAGTLALTASNAYTGATRVEAGTLSITGDKSLSDIAPLDVWTGAKMHIDFGTEFVGELQFDGNTQLAGTYGGPNSDATNVMQNWTGSGVILVSSDPFYLWLSGFPGYNLLSLANRQKEGDPDADGLTNLTEFAFNSDPVSGVPSGKVRSRTEVISTQQALVLTLPLRENAAFTGTGPAVGTVAADYLSYQIEGTNDLENFNQAVSEVTPVSDESSLPLLDTGWIYRSFRLNGNIGGGAPRGPAGFLRAGVSPLP